MQRDCFKIVLIIIIIASLLAAGYLLFQRHGLEEANNQIELAILYDDVRSFSAITGEPIDEVYAEFADLGATGILFKEPSLAGVFTRDRLFEVVGTREISVLSGRDFINTLSLYSGEDSLLDLNREALVDVRPEFTYLLTMDEAVYERTKRHLSLKVPENLLHIPEERISGVYYMGLSPDYDKVFSAQDRMAIGLGFPEDAMLKVAANDLNVLVQISSWPVTDDTNLREVFEVYDAEFDPLGDRFSLIAFNDPKLPGFPVYLDHLADEIAKFDVPVGYIEPFVYDQAGMANVGRMKLRNNEIDMSKRIARLHAISAGEMSEYSIERAVDRLTLGAKERNVRVMLLRLFPDDGTGSIVDTNVNYIESLVESLEDNGFTLGEASTFDLDVTSDAARNILMLIMGMGVIAAGLLLLHLVKLSKLGIVLALMGSLAWVAVIVFSLVVSGDFLFLETAVKIMALAATIIFPTLAVTVVLKEKKNSIQGTLLDFLKITTISLCGALLMAGFLSHLHYMLGLDGFVGVKVGLVLPVIMVMAIFYIVKGEEHLFTRIKNLLNYQVTVLAAAAVVVFAVVMGVLLLRSGNISEVLSLEEHFRYLLNEIFGVRPRTKEFLIGHPIMILLLYLGYNHKLLPLVAVGAIGQVSLVNTFAHIHTPVIISVLRTLNGLLLGIIGGIILIGLYLLAVKWKGRYFDEKG